VIARILKWWRSYGDWKREHIASWAPYVLLVDGSSRLRREAEDAVSSAAVAAGFTIEDRVVEPLNRSTTYEEYVRFRLGPTDVDVWLYADGAQVSTPTADCIIEEWDFRTPAGFLQTLVSEALEAAHASQAVPN
jgi:hypothetical protein